MGYLMNMIMWLASDIPQKSFHNVLLDVGNLEARRRGVCLRMLSAAMYCSILALLWQGMSI